MEELTLTKEQYIGYNVVELSVLFQRSIEILDELKQIDHKFKNKALQSQLTAIYPSLDKQTKLYNEFYNVSTEGITSFYDVTKKNAEYIMNYNILDKALICNFLMAHEKDPKSVEGIITKILKK